jgi:hypothetical protein
MSTHAIEEHVGVDECPEASALHAAARESETMVVLAGAVAARVEAMAGAGLPRVAEDGDTQGRGRFGTSVHRARKLEREASGS